MVSNDSCGPCIVHILPFFLSLSRTLELAAPRKQPLLIQEIFLYTAEGSEQRCCWYPRVVLHTLEASEQAASGRRPYACALHTRAFRNFRADLLCCASEVHIHDVATGQLDIAEMWHGSISVPHQKLIHFRLDTRLSRCSL